MHEHAKVIGLCALLSACSGAERPPLQSPRQPSVAEQRHRPRWVMTLEADVDAIVLCLRGRETPSHVLFVHHSPERFTAMTTTDAYGALEHCVVDEGVVLVRKPATERLADFEGLPLFSLGSRPPSVPPMTLLEEVVSDGAIVGWLHWPTSVRPLGDRVSGDASSSNTSFAIKGGT